MTLKDALLFGRVGAERTLVQLDGHHQHTTWGTKWYCEQQQHWPPSDGWDPEQGSSTSPGREEGPQLHQQLTAKQCLQIATLAPSQPEEKVGF